MKALQKCLQNSRIGYSDFCMTHIYLSICMFDSVSSWSISQGKSNSTKTQKWLVITYHTVGAS